MSFRMRRNVASSSTANTNKEPTEEEEEEINLNPIKLQNNNGRYHYLSKHKIHPESDDQKYKHTKIPEHKKEILVRDPITKKWKLVSS
jgi:hypothetical protein